MSIFATEMPVDPKLSKAKFAAAALAWVRGIAKSEVLSRADAKELHDDELWLETATGETLSIKSYEDTGQTAYGVRLELPDNLGRRWRTECVYSSNGTRGYLRVRGQCIADKANAPVSTPLKPHFVSQAIEDGWAVLDGLFAPQGKPVHLKEDDLSIAAAILNGTATSMLPSVYVSRGNKNKLPLDPKHLAKRMAGVCHVIVEPSRSFSFGLMEHAGRRNPYGGAIGIFAPDGREILRAFKPKNDALGSQLAKLCIEAANSFMSGLVAMRGWEWQHLQEAQARLLRSRTTLQNSNELDDYIDQFDAEIKSKDEQIENLTAMLEIERHKKSTDAATVGDILPEGLKEMIGPELYEGEFSDRLRHFLANRRNTSQTDLDPRTLCLIDHLLAKTEFSGRAAQLVAQIKQACRDGREMPKQLGGLLLGFEFTKTQDGKHVKYTPSEKFFGLQIEVLPSTPSDSQRGGRNRASDVIKSFGIGNLK